MLINSRMKDKQESSSIFSTKSNLGWTHTSFTKSFFFFLLFGELLGKEGNPVHESSACKLIWSMLKHIHNSTQPWLQKHTFTWSESHSHQEIQKGLLTVPVSAGNEDNVGFNDVSWDFTNKLNQFRQQGFLNDWTTNIQHLPHLFASKNVWEKAEM